MSRKKVKQLTIEDRNKLLSSTPYSLPDNPSNKGFSASQIKRKMYEGQLLNFDWMSGLQSELNSNYEQSEYELESIKDSVSEVDTNAKDYASKAFSQSTSYTDGLIASVRQSVSNAEANIESINDRIDDITGGIDLGELAEKVERYRTEAKQYTDSKVEGLINGAPEESDTLGELSQLIDGLGVVVVDEQRMARMSYTSPPSDNACYPLLEEAQNNESTLSMIGETDDCQSLSMII